MPQALNDFEELLDDLDRIDRDFDKHYAAFTRILVKWGYLKDFTKEVELQNFTIDDESYDETMAVSQQIWIGDLYGVKRDQISRKRKGYYHYDQNCITLPAAIQSNSGVIFPFSTIPNTAINFRSDVPIEEFYGKEDHFDKHYNIYMQLVVPVKDRRILHTVHSIDRFFPRYSQRAVQWWNTVYPMLCGDMKTGRFSAKIPFKPFPKPQPQLELPLDFEEWLFHRQNRMPKAVDI